MLQLYKALFLIPRSSLHYIISAEKAAPTIKQLKKQLFIALLWKYTTQNVIEPNFLPSLTGENIHCGYVFSLPKTQTDAL
jgi:hypothetical protein